MYLTLRTALCSVFISRMAEFFILDENIILFDVFFALTEDYIGLSSSAMYFQENIGLK